MQQFILTISATNYFMLANSSLLPCLYDGIFSSGRDTSKTTTMATMPTIVDQATQAVGRDSTIFDVTNE